MCKTAKKYWVIYLLISAILLSIFLLDNGINNFNRARFVDVIKGEAYKPYVYRVLIPIIIRASSVITPKYIKQYVVDNISSNSVVIKIFNKLNWEREYILEYSLAVIIIYFSLIGFLLSFRYLLILNYSILDPNREYISFYALFGLIPFMKFYGCLYDIPTLFLFTLGLGLILSENWKWYISIFAISCLNKETTILLTLVFIMHIGLKNIVHNKFYIFLLLLQLTIFTLIKAILFNIYRNNPGSFLEYHLFDHNIGLLKSYPVSTLFVWTAISILVIYKWKEKPLFLKRALIIIIPIFIMCLFFGIIDELRVYYEVYPIVVLLIAYSICKILNIDIDNKMVA